VSPRPSTRSSVRHPTRSATVTGGQSLQAWRDSSCSPNDKRDRSGRGGRRGPISQKTNHAAAGISDASDRVNLAKTASTGMSNNTRNVSRPRDNRERTVPSGMPRVAATSP
jgi:hypothetical protein